MINNIGDEGEKSERKKQGVRDQDHNVFTSQISINL